MTYIKEAIYLYTDCILHIFIFSYSVLEKYKIKKSFKIHNTITKLKVKEYNSEMTHRAKIKCIKMSNRSYQIFLLLQYNSQTRQIIHISNISMF